MAGLSRLSILWYAAGAALVLAGCAAAQANPGPLTPPLANYPNRQAARSAAQQLARLTSRQRRRLWEQLRRGMNLDERRWRAFNSTVNKVIRHNLDPRSTYFMGINELSDYTYAEIAATKLMRGFRPRRRPANVPVLRAPSARRLLQGLPDEFDLRSRFAVPPVRDQGGCGSCWAFAAVAAIEAKAMQDGVNAGPNLSEQQMVDCVGAAAGFGSAGCAGGYFEDVFLYASRRFVQPELAYRYAGRNGTCAARAGAGALALAAPGYAVVQGSAEAIMDAVYRQGPVAVYFYLEQSFLGYTSGVYPASACRNTTINHAMVVVGYSRADNPPYLIVRNSWGDSWGDRGYAKVEMVFGGGPGACGMYRFGSAVARTARIWQGSRPPPPSPRTPSRRPPASPPLPSPVQTGRLLFQGGSGKGGAVCSTQDGTCTTTAPPTGLTIFEVVPKPRDTVQLRVVGTNLCLAVVRGTPINGIVGLAACDPFDWLSYWTSERTVWGGKTSVTSTAGDTGWLIYGAGGLQTVNDTSPCLLDAARGYNCKFWVQYGAFDPPPPPAAPSLGSLQ